MRQFWTKHFRGMTLVELMAAILVVSLAVGTLIHTITQSIAFAYESEARIKAINIAREWIEAMINIRNTNWLRFSSNRKDCWNIFNYNSSCVAGVATDDYIKSWKYALYKENSAWKLQRIETNKSLTHIYIDNNHWYTSHQEITSPNALPICRNIKSDKNCRSIFSREITITYEYNDKNKPMNITSTVTWRGNKKVELTGILTNWKAHLSQ